MKISSRYFKESMVERALPFVFDAVMTKCACLSMEIYKMLLDRYLDVENKEHHTFKDEISCSIQDSIDYTELDLSECLLKRNKYATAYPTLFLSYKGRPISNITSVGLPYDLINFLQYSLDQHHIEADQDRIFFGFSRNYNKDPMHIMLEDKSLNYYTPQEVVELKDYQSLFKKMPQEDDYHIGNDKILYDLDIDKYLNYIDIERPTDIYGLFDDEYISTMLATDLTKSFGLLSIITSYFERYNYSPILFRYLLMYGADAIDSQFYLLKEQIQNGFMSNRYTYSQLNSTPIVRYEYLYSNERLKANSSDVMITRPLIGSIFTTVNDTDIGIVGMRKQYRDYEDIFNNPNICLLFNVSFASMDVDTVKIILKHRYGFKFDIKNNMILVNQGQKFAEPKDPWY